MTLTKRIIPCLDVKNGRVVKGLNFESIKDAGDPVELAAKYSAEGADELVAGADDQQALLIGIRCGRGSHTFFKKYADKFEDSEGKQIFAEFAAEEKQHLELLLKEYRELVKRQSQSVKPAKRVASRAEAVPLFAVLGKFVLEIFGDGVPEVLDAVLVGIGVKRQFNHG